MKMNYERRRKRTFVGYRYIPVVLIISILGFVTGWASSSNYYLDLYEELQQINEQSIYTFNQDEELVASSKDNDMSLSKSAQPETEELVSELTEENTVELLCSEDYDATIDELVTVEEELEVTIYGEELVTVDDIIIDVNNVATKSNATAEMLEIASNVPLRS